MVRVQACSVVVVVGTGAVLNVVEGDGAVLVVGTVGVGDAAVVAYGVVVTEICK